MARESGERSHVLFAELVVISAKETFTMKAFSSDFCPYDSKYCIPLPGVEVSSVLKRYCVGQSNKTEFA